MPLDRVEDGYAKVRTGGLNAESTPAADLLADFLCSAAARRLPFKATAGLHHPIRSTMHGFLNVFAGAAFAWQGMDRVAVARLLDETDPQAFEFRDDELRWREWRASTAEVEQARRDFAHSFGSCSFTEPLDGLRALGRWNDRPHARAGIAELGRIGQRAGGRVPDSEPALRQLPAGRKTNGFAWEPP